MVEREYIVSRWTNGHNSQQLPILVVKEKDVNSKPYRWKWGFRDTTGWDWLGLLLGPVLITVVLFLLGRHFDERAKAKEEYFNSEQNKQQILRNYLTTMTGLISDRKLSNDNKDLTNIAAKALTQSALTSFDKAVLPPKLRDSDKRVLTGKEIDALAEAEADANRKRQVLQFLNDAQLITNDSPKINMEGIDLNGANLAKFRLTPTGQPKQPYIIINLKKANLYKANINNAQLVKAQMESTQLPQAQLKGADLKGAKLNEANLQEANLTGANLQGADLTYADLTNANLTTANLSNPKTVHDARLIGANLTGAKLGGANLDHAQLNNANLTDADFRDAKMMDTVDITGATLCRTTMAEGTVEYPDCPRQAK